RGPLFAGVEAPRINRYGQDGKDREETFHHDQKYGEAKPPSERGGFPALRYAEEGRRSLPHPLTAQRVQTIAVSSVVVVCGPCRRWSVVGEWRSEEHTSELQSRFDLVCRLLLEKKKGMAKL